LLDKHPESSFGFAGARTIDISSGKVENYYNNQRFRVYSEVIARKFGTNTFLHIQYPEISCYLLLNKKSGIDLSDKEIAIKRMFATTYNNLPDL